MNFAFNAVLTILLILPGAGFIFSYSTGFQTESSSRYIPITDMLVGGILISLFFHTIFILFIYLFFFFIYLCFLFIYLCFEIGFISLNFEIDFISLYNIVSGKDLNINSNRLTSYFLQFGIYNIIINITTVGLAKLLRKYFKNNNIDLDYPIVATDNYWSLVFSGRLFEKEGVSGRLGDIDFIYVDILTEDEIIYSGILKEFLYNRYKDELEYLILGNAERHLLSKPEMIIDEKYIDPAKKSIHKTIPGDSLMVLAKNIKNINIFYVDFELNGKSVTK